jgi:hypothetical protein
VPELIGLRTLVAGTGLRRHAAAAAANPLEELVDVLGTDPVDLAPLISAAIRFGVPMGVQSMAMITGREEERN